jgi:hypothetical protein
MASKRPSFQAEMLQILSLSPPSRMAIRAADCALMVTSIFGWETKDPSLTLTFLASASPVGRAASALRTFEANH